MQYIYCDESCHLENDGFDIMVLGGITCPLEIKKDVFEDIRNIKIKHGLSSWFEIKWTKVSHSKIDFYIDLIDYFFHNEDLNFRGIVATNKKSLDHVKYNNGSHNNWYYKMYYLLLDPLIYPSEKYNILIDIKDTRGGPKTRKLKEVLCNSNNYGFNYEVINDISQINSTESEILQLTDLFIGSLSYYHRMFHVKENSNLGKSKIIQMMKDRYGIDYSTMTHRNEKKFNIFIWEPKGV